MAKVSKYEPHEACLATPPYSDERLQALVDSISTVGLKHPIVLWKDGRKTWLLDGRHRELGCDGAGVKPQYVYYEGDDPWGYVSVENEYSHEWDKNSTAWFAEAWATATNGGAVYANSGSSWDEPLLTRKAAAEKFGTSTAQIDRVRTVKNYGTPELVEAARGNKISLKDAAAIAQKPAEEQQEEIRWRGERKAQPPKRKPPEQKLREDVLNRIRIAHDAIDETKEDLERIEELRPAIIDVQDFIDVLHEEVRMTNLLIKELRK